jgi:SOS-response transcriptional repressor LexA
MIGLTAQQAACLNAIRRLTVGGVAPSFEELRADLGFCSKSHIHRLVKGLSERGAIYYRPNMKRSLRVLNDLEGIERHTSQHLLAMRDRIDAILKERAQ